MISNIDNNSQEINREILLPVEEVTKIHETKKLVIADSATRELAYMPVTVFEGVSPLEDIQALLRTKDLIATNRYTKCGRLILAWNPAFYGGQS